jgi:phosphopantothenoylcysteine decarboxylase / phosphopantothenate---cysteine ligase
VEVTPSLVAETEEWTDSSVGARHSVLPPTAGLLAGKTVVLCVTGSIAAFKAVALLRSLLREGAEVEVVLTRAGAEFVGAQTFSGLTGRPCHTGVFDAPGGGEPHIALAKRASLIVIAPATADTLARVAGGYASDLVSALVLSARCPVLVAPAMHPAMWANAATQRNVELLKADGRVFIGPVEGEVASGDIGLGRMSEPDEILAAVASEVSDRPLAGRHILVTAGPTVEDLDPVRFVSNRSSGKMGFALAEQAARLGARVTLIAGPVHLTTPYAVNRVDVRSAMSMREALWHALGGDLAGADALIMAAAVADYRPSTQASSKLKRDQNAMQLDLVPNPDLLAEVGHHRSGNSPVLVGFALETDTEERVIKYARAKLAQKRVDLVVANHADDALERDDNRATLVGVRQVDALGAMSKARLAEQILRWVVHRLNKLAS